MTNKTYMEFPCNFPVKIIGSNSDAFIHDIKNIILKHFPDFNQDNLVYKTSKGSNYLAITSTVIAQNQEMLDLFYQDLTHHPEVKMVL
jgi:putative lipoic acid-binding regulatory protein